MKGNDLTMVLVNTSTVQLLSAYASVGITRKLFDDNGRKYFRFDNMKWYVDELEEWGITVM